MKKVNENIYLRTVTPEEENAWRDIFYDSVRSHFAVLNLPEKDLNVLLEHQYKAQTTDYKKNYLQASNDLILYKGEVAGRLIISLEDNDLHLIDIVVLSKYRNQKIGTEVLKYLFAESRRLKLPIRFYVEKSNPAFNLYKRLGFKVIKDLEVHFQMTWNASENLF